MAPQHISTASAMAAPDTERQPCYIPFVLLEDGGDRSSIQLKAWASAAGVRWELRRVLRILMPKRGIFKVGGLLQRDLSGFRGSLQLLGITLEEEIKPSVRAAVHNAREAPGVVDVDEDLRDEWSAPRSPC